MSDGSSGNAFGEALESMATNTKQAVGGTLADFTQSAKSQISGKSQGGMSGSFTPGQQPQSPQNPNTILGLQGGDLFSPDMNKAKPQGQQLFQGQQPLTQAGQKAASSDVKSPEEMAKIQSIEAELRTMHKQVNNIEAEMEKARRNREEAYQKRLQEDQQKKEEKKMEQMQSQQSGQDISVFRGQRGTEIKGQGTG